MEHEHQTTTTQQFKPIFGVAAAILFAGTIGFFWILTQMNSEAPRSANTADTINEYSENPLEITESDHVRGSTDAVVTLIEYSDYECPFCQQFHPTVQRLLSEYDGKVRWVFRHFPLPSHRTAAVKAQAAECVAELGGNDAFWQFTDILFTRGPSVPAGALGDIAVEIGLDKVEFNDCVAENRYANFVTAQAQSGTDLGITGTPGSLLVGANGQVQLIPGAVPYEQLKAQVDALLQ